MLSTKFATEQTSSNVYSVVTRNIKKTIKNISSLTGENLVIASLNLTLKFSLYRISP